MSEAIDVLIKKYSAEAQRIYENQTAGDHTWSGLLGYFVVEMEAIREKELVTANEKVFEKYLSMREKLDEKDI